MVNTPQTVATIIATTAIAGALLWIALRVIRHIIKNAPFRTNDRLAVKDVEELIDLYSKILDNDKKIKRTRVHGYPENARVWTELNNLYLQQASAKRARLLETVHRVAPGPEGDKLVHQHTIAEAHARLIGLHRLQPPSTGSNG